MTKMPYLMLVLTPALKKNGVGYTFTMVTQYFTRINRTFTIITIKTSNIDLNVKM